MASKKATATLFKTTKQHVAAPTPPKPKVNYSWFEKTRPILFLSIAGISFWAGNWQVGRRKEKMEYLNYVHSRLGTAPVDCPTELTPWTMKENKFLKVKIEGTPYFDKEIIVGPRVPPRSAGITKYPGWGGYIYTPFKLKNSDKFVVINRGWIPEEEVNRAPETHYIDLNTGEYIEMKCNTIDKKDKNNNNNKNNKNNTNIESNNGERETISFVGLLAPLQFIPDFFDDFDMSKTFWPWVSKEKMVEKWKDIGFECGENNVPVTLNVIEPRKDFSQWPQRITKEDLLAVTVSPEQHGSYVMFWYSMSIIALWYTYVFWRNPRATRIFPRRRNKPLLKRSDVLSMPEKELKF